MALAYLLLGTNLGDRTANLDRAGGLLEGYFGPRIGFSRTEETKAVGFEGPDFLNRVEVYRTRRKPMGVLSVCKAIERKMGRREILEYRPDGSRVYHSRIIDIDILEYRPSESAAESLTIDSPALMIPHPQVRERAFVRPLLDETIKQTIKTQ